MELGQAEALGVFHHHDGGVWDVDAHLHHGGGDQKLDPVRFEIRHDGILFRRLHPAVEQPYGAAGELPGQTFLILGRRQHDARCDIYLTSQMLLNEMERPFPLVGVNHQSFHRLAAFRQLIQHGDVQVPV